MSRSTSALFRQAAYGPQTGEVVTMLLTLDHDDLAAPIRVSTDNKDTFAVDGVTIRGTISNGENYAYCPMRITLPDDSEESISEARIEIDNIDREILASIRSISSAPTVSMQVVLASQPDTVEARYDNFALADVQADAFVVSGRLTLGNFLGEPYPGGSVLPSNFPGAFK